ncbi:hypothetical protein H0A36_18905 [Endozoicomonas sp. SM1973]|uniref:Uncharacterized protein n=1 Tax=Spartinivicinus marinus TaxID=2994442 RepID=A0A853I5U5_9GAMM|nr:hypothetical protein [Spartinivicinus marinus]MCX4029758.1 hypothetical protein [Spartinivicinus marinus]NYZ68089.1 hypothetical protein [Spartinivicinus marinus]
MSKDIKNMLNQVLEVMSNRTLLDGALGAGLGLLGSFFCSGVGLSGLGLIGRFFMMVIGGGLVGIAVGLIADFKENNNSNFDDEEG